MKASFKLTDEQKELLIDIIAKGLIDGNPSTKMALELKEITGVEVTEQNISYYRINHRDKIAERIEKMCGELVKDCPIVKKDFRLYQIQEAFLKATDVKTRLACIREARNEIDAHGDKIADAIGRSGSRLNIFDFGKLSDEDRESYAKQCEKYFAHFNGNGSRIHIPE
mgnify:CR=1 FL=1